MGPGPQTPNHAGLGPHAPNPLGLGQSRDPTPTAPHPGPRWGRARAPPVPTGDQHVRPPHGAAARRLGDTCAGASVAAGARRWRHRAARRAADSSAPADRKDPSSPCEGTRPGRDRSAESSPGSAGSRSTESPPVPPRVSHRALHSHRDPGHQVPGPGIGSPPGPGGGSGAAGGAVPPGEDVRQRPGKAGGGGSGDRALGAPVVPPWALYWQFVLFQWGLFRFLLRERDLAWCHGVWEGPSPALSRGYCG